MTGDRPQDRRMTQKEHEHQATSHCHPFSAVVTQTRHPQGHRESQSHEFCHQKSSLYLTITENKQAETLAIKMKFTVATSALLVGSAAAFSTFGARKAKAPAKPVFTVESLPGIIEPTGLFDPLGLAAKANEKTLKRYREAEITHGRVAMLAVLGFLAGEAVEGSSFLFDAQVSGPAITHLSQVPPVFWALLTIGIGATEQRRAEIGWVEPENVPVAQPGLLRENYEPGNIGFDPLGLKPTDPVALKELATKELQNGRLAMLAAAGFIAQEMVNGKGILENLSL